MLTDQQRLRITRLRAKGASYRQIARATRHSTWTVYYVLQQTEPPKAHRCSCGALLTTTHCRACQVRSYIAAQRGIA